MKHFLFFTFLLLAIFVKAQNIEEIYYVPSSSGYYTNLIVKGDANINNLVTSAFDLHSYGSLLDIRVANANNQIDINNLVMETSSGTATFITGENPEQINASVLAGYLSFTISQNNPALNINSIQLPHLESQNFYMQLNTNNLNVKDNNSLLNVTGLEIYGMQVPSCPNNYYWQPVTVGGKSYNILACNTTACNNPQDEEACINKDPFYGIPFSWDSVLCHCVPW